MYKPLICFVIFLQPFHAGLVFLRLSSCFLWKMQPVCSVYTAGWKTRPPDCKYKHGAGFFQACTLSQLSQTSNQSLLGNIHPAQNQTDFFFFILLLFALHWSCALVFWDYLCMVYFYGTAIWRLSKCQCHLSCSSSAPSLWVVRKRGTGAYCISWPIVSNEYPDKQVGALMWAPGGPDSPNLRLPGLFFNKALMLAGRPQCSVSLIVRWEPSGMLMNIQWGFVSRTVLPLSTSPSLSSPLKLQARFTGLLLQGGHLAHCDANSLKFDV